MNPVIPNINIPGIIAKSSPSIIGFPSPQNPATIFRGSALMSVPAMATPTVARNSYVWANNAYPSIGPFEEY